MADKIKNDHAATPGIYEFWVDGNAYEPRSAYLINDLITKWIDEGREWDEAKAMDIFSRSMEFESKVFNECGYEDKRKRINYVKY